jgi:hypothetical protein
MVAGPGAVHDAPAAPGAGTLLDTVPDPRTPLLRRAFRNVWPLEPGG